jgi:trans-aconitate methyltransferase
MSNKYENIAEFYQICLPDFWIPFTKLLEKKIPNIKYNLLDLGCGTGDAVKYLENYINLYLGIDHSNEMLEIAKKKYPNFEFIKGDIVEYNNTLNIKYDIVLAAFDTMNHLLDKLYWEKLFSNAYSFLETNGFFIFDICTANDHKNNWKNYVDVIEKNSFTWIRKGNYCNETNLATIQSFFYILNPSNKLYRKEYDVINQISFEVEEVIEMLTKQNFSDISVYDLHFGGEVNDQTSVATFFCKK